MGHAVILLPLLLPAPAAGAAPPLPPADLRRAKQRVPGPGYLASSSAGVDVVLNAHLRRLPAATAPCSGFALPSLLAALRALDALRHPALADVYADAADTRGGVGGVAAAAAAAAAAAGDDDAAGIVRDALCRHA
eukprot:gene22177-20153_t